jgi:DNA-binding NtrC family response regulator
MAHSRPTVAEHPAERLVGTSPGMAALRAQIRHLARFDTLGSAAVPTVLLQGETGTGKGLVARVMHDSGPRATGPFLTVNCAAIPETMLEAELFGFEPGAFTDAKRAKAGLFEAASGGTLFLDEIDALPFVVQGKLLTAIETKRVRRLGAVAERAVDVKLIAATNAVLTAAMAAGRFRADLYHRLAVVVLALPPLRERGADILALAQALLQHYATVHRVAPKPLQDTAQAWLQHYAWPGNVRELSHLMERIVLLHVGAEVDATTLQHLCLPPPPAAFPAAPPAAVAEQGHVAPLLPDTQPPPGLPDEAAQIRHALAQTHGNVVRAARLLGVSRDTLRYRMRRYRIARPRHTVMMTAVREPSPGAAASQPPLADRDAPLQEVAHTAADSAPPLPASPDPEPPETETAALPHTGESAGVPRQEVFPPPLAWEQKPVAVLALEVTWPEIPGRAWRQYEPWTEATRWEQAIMEKVRGFGGVLVQQAVSLFTWVFGLPHAFEQLPLRAVHGALAIRQMVAEAGAPDLGPCPEVRLAVHLGGILVDSQAQPLTAHVFAVGETLALPVRLLGHAAPGEILVSPQVGRLVAGAVALAPRRLRLRAKHAERVEGYAVVGVNPGRTRWPGAAGDTRGVFVGREREVALLEAVVEQVTASRGQVVGLVGPPGIGKSRLLARVYS